MDKETAKDQSTSFLKEIGQRFANPLFYSYIISWLIFNWEIPSAILFDKLPDLGNTFSPSYTSYISRTIRLKGSGFWLYPLFSAIAYVLISPLIREGIAIFNVIISKYSYRIMKKESDGSYIPIKEFFHLKATYDKEVKTIQDLYEREYEKIREYNDVETENAQLKTNTTQLESKNGNLELHINSLSKQLTIVSQDYAVLKNQINPAQINGLWEVFDDDNIATAYYYFENKKGAIMHYNLKKTSTFDIIMFQSPPITFTIRHDNSEEGYKAFETVSLVIILESDDKKHYKDLFNPSLHWERVSNIEIENILKNSIAV